MVRWTLAVSTPHSRHLLPTDAAFSGRFIVRPKEVSGRERGGDQHTGPIIWILRLQELTICLSTIILRGWEPCILHCRTRPVLTFKGTSPNYNNSWAVSHEFSILGDPLSAFAHSCSVPPPVIWRFYLHWLVLLVHFQYSFKSALWLVKWARLNFQITQARKECAFSLAPTKANFIYKKKQIESTYKLHNTF